MLSVAGIRQDPVKVSSSSCFACCISLISSKPLNRAHPYDQGCSNDAGEHRQKIAKEHGGVCDCYEKVPRSRDEISYEWRFTSEVQGSEMDGMDLICKACIRAWFRPSRLENHGDTFGSFVASRRQRKDAAQMDMLQSSVSALEKKRYPEGDSWYPGWNGQVAHIAPGQKVGFCIGALGSAA
jgi:hypothetical protein